jgi:hypothetical protein
MPGDWQNEPVECSLIILRALEELLAMLLPEFSRAISSHIGLQ